MKKTLHFLRHGNAQHNVNAEPLRAAGCTFQQFLDQMQIDDAFDSALTALGVEQAKTCGELPATKAISNKLELIVTR